MDLPRLADYCDWSTDAKLVAVGELDLYFSYQTCVAFRWRGRLVCSENVWSKTTGRHLGRICPDKQRRVKHAEFEGLLFRVLAEFSEQKPAPLAV